MRLGPGPEEAPGLEDALEAAKKAMFVPCEKEESFLVLDPKSLTLTLTLTLIEGRDLSPLRGLRIRG